MLSGNGGYGFRFRSRASQLLLLDVRRHLLHVRLLLSLHGNTVTSHLHLTLHLVLRRLHDASGILHPWLLLHLHLLVLHLLLLLLLLLLMLHLLLLHRIHR